MPVASNETRLTESMKTLYRADQQVKFLHLQAEVETLLHQLQSLKRQRLTNSEEVEANDNSQ